MTFRWLFPILFLIVASTSQGAILFSDNFDGYADSPANHGWSMGSSVSVVESGCRSGRCVKIAYVNEGTSAYVFQRSISTPEIWVRFYFKMSNHANPGGGGFKFLKLFGSRTLNSYANATFGPDYNNGILGGVLCGDGVFLENDTNIVYRFNGNISGTPQGPLTILNYTSSYDMPSNQNVWHSFEVHVKFNTDGIADGEYQVWIDGVDWYHVKGVKNRNDANVRNFVTLSLGDYGRGGAFDIYYDDVAYGNAYIGPINNLDLKIPNPPARIQVP